MNFVFDLYGTLIDVWTDEEREELWEGVASLIGDGEDKGTAVRREYLTLCHQAKRDESHEIDLLAVFESMLASRSVDTSVADALALEFRRLSMVRLSRFPYAKEILTDLKAKGAGVYLLSNAQSCFTLDELRTTGLYDLFDGIAISSEMGVKKPYPAAFATALSRFGIRAEDSFYVGNDMRDDILGASTAGMRTVYIETEQSGSYPELDIHSPNYTVQTHQQMHDLLLSLAALDKA